MRVLIFATGADTGGQGYRIAAGFGRRAPSWQVEAVAALNPLGYPEQSALRPVQLRAHVRERYQWADVVHLRNSLEGFRVVDRGRRKPLVLHHHGTAFRAYHQKLTREAAALGATQVASTLDLVLLQPGVEWLPSPYHLEELAALRASEYEPDGVVRIAHFPTNTARKGTAAFLEAVAALRARGLRLELVTNVRHLRNRRPVHTPTPWPQVMAQKARADILYDQLELGYGNNAIEAFGMGIPVVAGVADLRVRHEMLRRFGELPFVDATPQTLQHVLGDLVASAAMRREYGQRGLEHARRFHDERVVVGQLVDIYGHAAAQAVAV